MSQPPFPQQSGGMPGPAAPAVPARPPVPPAASEATRLLCVGVHHDRAFREAVLDELSEHEERFVAPSVGIDAGRVLSHAARARRSEAAWAGGILAAWAAGVALTGPLLLTAMFWSLVLGVARWVRGRGARPSLLRRVVAFYLRWNARVVLAFLMVFVAVVAFGGSSDDSASPDAQWSQQGDEFSDGPDLSDFTWRLVSSGLDIRREDAALILFVLVVVTALVALRRGQFARVVSNELSPRRFPVAASDPAETSAGRRTQWLRTRLRAEQHQPLVMYDAARPFCGFGFPFATWTLAVEMRPRKDREPEPLDNGAILRRIVPLLEALRVPSPRVDARTADTVLDRLRELGIDECVFLPADRLEARDGAPFHPQALEQHRLDALEEGGEARRHFLRIRVGGWDEELVVTVFVRVHTQGGMLMAEFAPHLLTPVRREYRQAERDARRHINNSWPGQVAWALTHMPVSLGQSVQTLGVWFAVGVRRLLSGNAGAPAEGPAVAIRELGADEDVSLFQDMDVSRYLKTIQERVAGGVTLALHEAGWQTEEFEQKIINVSGGVYIDSARDSAIGVGDHNTVSAGRTSGTTNTGKASGTRGAGQASGASGGGAKGGGPAPAPGPKPPTPRP
ncbi:hypothetical protein AB0J21_19170 [Streptomyces sp. NPDC049954]|uniref:hypothetical protein n=1 Tax=Streptomyces sp. NPDC049954 TaxID=3155779 RepID=UPI003418D741